MNVFLCQKSKTIMLKFYNYDIVFQEVPDEITLALNITGCPNRCPGCHSRHLWKDEGIDMTADTLRKVIGPYLESVTCVGLMGGDQDPQEIQRLACWLRETYPGLKVAWYSGRQLLPEGFDIHCMDYIKLGPWIAERGTLKNPNTNQRLYRVTSDGLNDITARFRSPFATD